MRKAYYDNHYYSYYGDNQDVSQRQLKQGSAPRIVTICLKR